MPTLHQTPQAGYTLIELLVYVGVVGLLLLAVVSFFGTVIDARVKNQTIAEVNDQGTLALDRLTQTIRNATSITSPAAGASGSSLTLTVPTGSLSPTVFDLNGSGTLGYNAIGATTDSNDANSINACPFTANASGTVSTLYAYIGSPVGTSPNNLGQMAIYSGTSSPTTLLASSGSVTLTANGWNAFPISSINVTNGQTYWLAYNTNGNSISNNNMRFNSATTISEMFVAQTFGSWPSSWTGSTSANVEFSTYAPIVSSTTPALRITEGVGSPVLLTDSRVQVTALSFNDLTRSGTAGLVQISLTLSRINASGNNDYTYTKTFTTSAEIGW